MFIITEYFFNQEKFYYLIQIHLSVAVVIGIMMILSTGTTSISYTQYVCALFKIARYENAHINI
jgi:5,10-methylenetetrahydrofolate reductase